MKNIQAQYQDLLEGKMSKANFMRNVRMQFPQYISPVNSFDDSIRVLKGKRILSESHDANTVWIDNFRSEIEDRIEKSQIPLDKEDLRTALETADVHKLLSKYEGKTYLQAADAFEDEVLGYNDPEQAKEDERIDHLRKGSKELEELNEAEKKTPSIDHVDYIQLTRGTEFELSKMRILSDENYLKAKERAYKKLVKNPNAYRHLTVANYAEVEKKDKVLKPREVKKEELSDKPNQMKTLKKDVTSNTKDNLGKKERRRGAPKGVQQLREEMLKEFGGGAVPEIKKRFANGHEVVTPEGKVGQIEELSHDGTATIVYEDGTRVDFQENVLKTVEEDRAERDFDPEIEGKPSDAFKRFSSEKSGEEAAAAKKAETHNNLQRGSKVKVDAAAAKALKLDPDKTYTVKDFHTTGTEMLKSVDVEFVEGGRVNINSVESAEPKSFGTVGKQDLGKHKLNQLKEKLVQAMKEELYDDPTSTTDKPIVATSQPSKNALKRAGMKEIPGTKDVK